MCMCVHNWVLTIIVNKEDIKDYSLIVAALSESSISTVSIHNVFTQSVLDPCTHKISATSIEIKFRKSHKELFFKGNSYKLFKSFTFYYSLRKKGDIFYFILDVQNEFSCLKKADREYSNCEEDQKECDITVCKPGIHLCVAIYSNRTGKLWPRHLDCWSQSHEVECKKDVCELMRKSSTHEFWTCCCHGDKCNANVVYKPDSTVTGMYFINFVVKFENNALNFLC